MAAFAEIIHDFTDIKSSHAPFLYHDIDFTVQYTFMASTAIQIEQRWEVVEHGAEIKGVLVNKSAANAWCCCINVFPAQGRSCFITDSHSTCP